MEPEPNVRVECFTDTLLVHIGHARMLSIYVLDLAANSYVDVFDGLNAFGRWIGRYAVLALIGNGHTFTKGFRCNEGIFVQANCATTTTVIEYEPIWVGEDKE
jgi:hypothetical protein